MRPRRPARATRIRKDNENTLQYACVDHLRIRAAPAVWWHHSPNECIRDDTVIHQRRMGCIFGFWDLVIFKPLEVSEVPLIEIDEPHWFELKTRDGNLTDNEQKFRGMLYMRGAKHKVCRDVDTFVNQCLDWGLIE